MNFLLGNGTFLLAIYAPIYPITGGGDEGYFTYVDPGEK